MNELSYLLAGMAVGILVALAVAFMIIEWREDSEFIEDYRRQVEDE